MHDIGHQFLDFRDSLGIAGAALAGICQLLLVTLLRRAADISVILQGIPPIDRARSKNQRTGRRNVVSRVAILGWSVGHPIMGYHPGTTENLDVLWGRIFIRHRVVRQIPDAVPLIPHNPTAIGVSLQQSGMGQ